jgi:hypothetical protein
MIPANPAGGFWQIKSAVCNKSAGRQENQNHQYAVFGVTFVTPAIVAAVPAYVVRARTCSLVGSASQGDGAAVGLISFDHPRQIVGVAVVGVSANKQCQCFALTKL